MSVELHEIPVAAIFDDNRMREDYGDLEQLKFSIEQFGLMQPVVVEPRPEEKYRLIAGGRRFRAFQELGKVTIPAMFRDNLDDLTRAELEAEENLNRKDFNWIEECKAFRKIHALKQQQFKNNFPERFGRSWSQKDTAEAIRVSEGKLSQDIALADALDAHPQLAKANTKKEAQKMLRHLQNNCIPDESLLKKKIRDCFVHRPFPECLEKVVDHSVDLLITDVANYDPRKVIPLLIPKLSFVSHAYMFFPLEQLSDIVGVLAFSKMNFHKRPFLWHVKGEDTYQTFLWFSPALAMPPKGITEHLSHRRSKESIHTLEKPGDVYYTLVINSSGRGALVLDPISYGVLLIRTCLDNNRNCVAFCGDRIVHEQVLLNV